MTEIDLRRIESELRVKLPDWYRDVSGNYPFRTSSANWMFDTPERVIAASKYPLQDGEFDTARWKASYVAIGTSAAGDVYLVDTQGHDSTVLCLSHEDHSITPEWPSFQEFVDDWREYEMTQASARDSQGEFDRWFWRRWRRVMLVIVLLAVVLPLLLILLAEWMKT